MNWKRPFAETIDLGAGKNNAARKSLLLSNKAEKEEGNHNASSSSNAYKSRALFDTNDN